MSMSAELVAEVKRVADALERIAAAAESGGARPKASGSNGAARPKASGSNGAARPASNGAGGPTLPNYGKSKGQPIAGADLETLRYYEKGCLRTLDDPGKERFHERERAMLAAIRAEIDRQELGPAPVDAEPEF